jgi:diacylglycerol kinase family enzyme
MIVILNKKSGGGTALIKWNQVCPRLNLNGSTEAFIVGINGSVDKLILDSIKKGETDFVIAGGDGSVNYLLNLVMSSLEPNVLKQIKIGAVGIGSSNDFHKPILSNNTIGNVPFKINFEDAVERDIGCLLFKKDDELLKKYLLINASLGITAEGNKFFNSPDFILKSLKKLNTQIAITYAAIKNIFVYKNFEAKIESNGESFKANISNMGILKSPFFTGSLCYQSNPILKDGLFDVHLYQSLSKPELINLFLALSKGKPDNSFNKKFWKTNKIKISSQEEFAVEFDGEVITTKNVEFYVIPRIIKVCIN